jgi:hypothetical protein
MFKEIRHFIAVLWILFVMTSLAGCGGEKSGSRIKKVKNLTLFVHGFDKDGYKASGTFGEKNSDEALEKFQALGESYPITKDKTVINIAKSTTYYGDTPPAYYSEKDIQDLKAVTAQWDGGIPRYAMIIAKYAKHLMQQEKVERINIVSGSMGSLVTRWMIEKNVEGLASDKKIVKWYSLEGVITGNYAADRKEYIEKFYGGSALDSIDITHMTSDWIEENFQNPVSKATSPYYKDILLGQQASTDDGLNKGSLTALLFLNGQFSANDGTQRVKDCRFDETLPEARFNDLSPTFTLIHKNHLSLKDHKGAWANVMIFLNAKKRVKITLLDAKVEDIQEDIRWYNKKAEIVFASKVYSPQIEKTWGIKEAIAENTRSGATLAVHNYSEDGEENNLNQFILDQFVAADETNLMIDFKIEEIDYAAKYGVYERLNHHYDLIDKTQVTVPLENGNYPFSGDNWSFHLKVEVLDYL